LIKSMMAKPPELLVGTIERMCQLAGVSRAGFHRSRQEPKPVEEYLEEWPGALVYR
jgi:hypothetical protein